MPWTILEVCIMKRAVPLHEGMEGLGGAMISWLGIERWTGKQEKVTAGRTRKVKGTAGAEASRSEHAQCPWSGAACTRAVHI